MSIARDSNNLPVPGDFMASSCKPAFAVFLTASTITGPILSKPDDISMDTFSKAELFRCNVLLSEFFHRPGISRRSPITAVNALSVDSHDVENDNSLSLTGGYNKASFLAMVEKLVTCAEVMLRHFAT
jgi:hypothetical protein